MKILLISPYFYPHKGGSQHYAEELYVKIMKSNPGTTVDVLCYNTDKSKSIEEYRGFTIYRVPCFQILQGQFAIPNYISLWMLLKKLFQKNRYDFVNSHTRFFESSWWTPFVAAHFYTKSILTDHCAGHPIHDSFFITKIAFLIDMLLSHTIIKRFDFTTAASSATKDFLLSQGIHNVQVMHGGVDTKYFKPKKKNTKRLIKSVNKVFLKNDIVISFVGRMITSKGPQILLNTAEKISKKYKNVYFIFGGDGKLFKELSVRKTNQIFFTGSLEKNQVRDLLSKSDIFVLPSMHHEGFPIALLEAGASGCAVITTDMGGICELINPKTGILTKPTVTALNSRIDFLIKNRKTSLKLGEELRKCVVKQYDWKIIAKNYSEFIKNKIQKKPLACPNINISPKLIRPA